MLALIFLSQHNRPCISKRNDTFAPILACLALISPENRGKRAKIFKSEGQTCQVEKMRANVQLEIKIGAAMQFTLILISHQYIWQHTTKYNVFSLQNRNEDKRSFNQICNVIMKEISSYPITSGYIDESHSFCRIK
jgi:hypothetical protein